MHHEDKKVNRAEKIRELEKDKEQWAYDAHSYTFNDRKISIPYKMLVEIEDAIKEVDYCLNQPTETSETVQNGLNTSNTVQSGSNEKQFLLEISSDCEESLLVNYYFWYNTKENHKYIQKPLQGKQ